jgi:tight adherence protein B
VFGWWTLLRSKFSPHQQESPGVALAYLATFIQAGLSPVSAWRELALVSPGHAVPQEISYALAAHEGVAAAVSRITREHDYPWRAVGACWNVARQSGAPLGPALGSLSQALLEVDKTKRDIKAAMAGPIATIRLIALLPLLALLGGGISGAGSQVAIFSTPGGITTLLVAMFLMGGAWWWLRLLSHRAQPKDQDWSLELDLFATATAGGGLPERAHVLVRATLEDYGLSAGPTPVLGDLVALSRRAGVPVGGLASGQAALSRILVASAWQQRVEKLAVHVVIPLGLLVLPAFVMIAVFPVLMGTWGAGIL